MVISSKRGAVSLGLTVLVFIVIAFVVLIVLSSAVRSYLIGGLDYFGSLFNQASGGGPSTGTAKTTFIAYSCLSTPCQPFPKTDSYFWFIDYNGVNSSSQNVSVPIYFTEVVGNYSFTAYDINYSGSTALCSNITTPVPHSGYVPAGDVKVIYYFYCS